MKHSVAHDLTTDMARKVTERALASYQARFTDYNPQVTWLDETTAEVTFQAKGMMFRGTFMIQPSDIVVEMDVPLLLRPFRQKALDIVDTEIRRWLDEARKGVLA